MQADLKRRDEEKRERAANPLQRWQNIQAAIAFAEANMKQAFRRNRPRWRDEQGRVHYY